jgi:hypothetical protein
MGLVRDRLALLLLLPPPPLPPQAAGRPPGLRPFGRVHDAGSLRREGRGRTIYPAAALQLPQ